MSVEGDDLIVEGDGAPPAGGALIQTRLDHRMAMAFLVLGLAAEIPVRIDDARPIATSFPDFVPLMNRLGAAFRGDRVSGAPIVVAIDGPAASGKGTLARRLARHFGFAHLDTGKLYRATALAVLDAGGDPHDAPTAEKAARRPRSIASRRPTAARRGGRQRRLDRRRDPGGARGAARRCSAISRAHPPARRREGRGARRPRHRHGGLPGRRR